MAILRTAAPVAASLLALLALGPACYQPVAQDCQISCGAAIECLEGQVCNPEGWCVGPPELRCEGTVGPLDATVGDGGVGAPDAMAALDASPTASLRVVVQRAGQVRVDPAGTLCTGTSDLNGDCQFPADAGTTVTLVPIGAFREWRTDNCVGQMTCTLTLPAGETLVRARFAD